MVASYPSRTPPLPASVVSAAELSEVLDLGRAATLLDGHAVTLDDDTTWVFSATSTAPAGPDVVVAITGRWLRVHLPKDTYAVYRTPTCPNCGAPPPGHPCRFCGTTWEGRP